MIFPDDTNAQTHWSEQPPALAVANITGGSVARFAADVFFRWVSFALEMNSIDAPHPKHGLSTVERIVASLPFFAAAWWIGGVALRVLLQTYGGPFFGSFGYVLNFGLFTVYEPWSSWFALICSACLVWGGCSVLRRSGGLRLGAIVAAFLMIVFLLTWLSSE